MIHKQIYFCGKFKHRPLDAVIDRSKSLGNPSCDITKLISIKTHY